MTGHPRRPSSRGFIATILRKECGLSYRKLLPAFFSPRYFGDDAWSDTRVPRLIPTRSLVGLVCAPGLNEHGLG